MKIFIVHTNHAHQMMGHEAGNAYEFMNYLEGICHLHQIELIAEELSIEALLNASITESTCQFLSVKFKINHIFCDPNSIQRALLGIPTTNQLRANLKFGKALLKHEEKLLKIEEQKYWPIRENYWINCITSQKFQNCLFICGSDHFESFEKQLLSKNISFVVVNKKWEPNA
jgi:hypothetical protein